MEVSKEKWRKRKFQEIDEKDIIIIDDTDTGTDDTDNADMQFQEENTKFPFPQNSKISEMKRRHESTLPSTRERRNLAAEAQQSSSSQMIHQKMKAKMENREDPIEPLRGTRGRRNLAAEAQPLPSSLMNNRTKMAKMEKVDDKVIIVIDDVDDEDMQFQKAILLSLDFDNQHAKKETARTDSVLDNTDPKGKKQIQFRSSKTERGQSSRTASQNPRIKVEKIYCKICMDATPIAETFTIKPCNHIFCNSCTIHYISSKMEQNVSTVSCPDPGCKIGFLDPVLCKDILPREVFEKWGLLLCESSIGVNRKFYCPFKDCSALLLREEGIEITNSECPYCHRMFCAKCKVPWHGEITCQEFQKLDKNERGGEDLMLKKLAKNNKWQRCPQCKMYVEKIDGCMFMKCRCGYCFCYVCATPMSRLTHYCTKCKR